jgi:hypothetical protein
MFSYAPRASMVALLELWQISLLGGMKNVTVVPLPQTSMFLPHGVGFFAVSNEQTDLPVTYNYMHTRLDCSALIFGKYLATSCLMDQGATMWCLFCWND